MTTWNFFAAVDGEAWEKRAVKTPPTRCEGPGVLEEGGEKRLAQL